VAPEVRTTENRRLIVQGVAWNTIFQAFQVVVSFGAMLVLARFLPPSEYGRATAAVGWLLLMGSFNCGQFMNHALQLPADQEPNWSLHWSAGVYIQGTLCILSQLVAGLCWFVPSYRPVAPLLHLAGVGVLLECPNRLRGTMLRRCMDFRRFRLIYAAGTLTSIVVTVAFAVRGYGAYAIVLGQNVVSAMPFSIDLFLILRWRPELGWWRWPDWSAYRPSIHFGLQQAASSLLSTLRGAAETAVLPITLGFVAMGLWNRGQALYTSTFGRSQVIVLDTVYPLLPRYAAEPGSYPRYATLFSQAMLWVAFAGMAYLGVDGSLLSRVVYGTKWVAADPVIWPGALAGLGLTMFVTASSVLLAANRLRSCFSLDVLSASLLIPVLAVTWIGGGLVTYAWAVASAQILLGAFALWKAGPLLNRNWGRTIIVPPLLSSVVASAIVWFLNKNMSLIPLSLRLILTTAIYLFIFVTVIRIIFRQPLSELLACVPGGPHVRRALLIPVVTISTLEPSQ
jgi:O-antigen/teichoic acid export membrane protein